MSRIAALLLPLVFACSSCAGSSSESPDPATPTAAEPSAPSGTLAAPPAGEDRAVAVFAGGCFWCMEHPFETVQGVESVLSGYAGGPEGAPTYSEVSSGGTGHTEAIRILYDPSVVTYDELLELFWHNIDPTDADGQFCDRGTQYRTAIFPQNETQRASAETSMRTIAAQLGQEIATQLESADDFWIAEDYHQDFYRTHPARYTSYRRGCGRDARLQEIWGSASH